MSDPLREDIVDLFASNPNAEAGDLLDVIRVWAAEAAPPSDAAAPLREAARLFIEDHDGDKHSDATWPCDGRCVQARALRAALTPEADTPSEYGRLLAERDRLIASGVDPADLDIPDAP